MPYTYTLAWQAANAGLPLMRPLWLNYPDDPRTWDMGSQYLWGDDLLVAPVTREGARHRAVYLPEGTWFDFWTWQRYGGGVALEVPAPLERMPLFVRQGAIIPMAPVSQYDGELAWRDLDVLVCPSADESSFVLYEDDGRTNGHKRGLFVTSEIRCRRDGETTVVEIGEPEGESALLPPGRGYVIRLRHDGPDPQVSEEGGADLLRLDPDRRSADRGWWREGSFLMVRPQGRAFRIVVRPGT
jgi:alpha-glucosidase